MTVCKSIDTVDTAYRWLFLVIRW